MKKENRVLILDTTLRDGEQSPGISWVPEQKVRMAKSLEALGVDIIEGGFPAAHEHHQEAMRTMAVELESVVLAGLSRLNRGDLECTLRVLERAKRPRVHTFIATSELHMREKLRMSPEAVLAKIEQEVCWLKQYCDDIEFSAEDAFRSDRDFLRQACQIAIEAGAKTINLPDTVGYAMPAEYALFIKEIREGVTGKGIIFSAHCHDDLGQACANTLEAVRIGGARQVEVSINGIGERAGNCALEEVVMALKTRSDYFGVHTGIVSERLLATSKLVAQESGFAVAPNKAIVGVNAFRHASGIHQAGMLKNRNTYEIMSPESVGWDHGELTLGKLSGRAALTDYAKKSWGVVWTEKEAQEAFELYKKGLLTASVSEVLAQLKALSVKE